MKTQSGFTLIETIIYIALFSLIMSGAVVGMYTLFESTAHNNSEAQLEEEGNYLSQKIDWYLSQVKTIQSPPTSGGVLSIIQNDGSTVTIDTRSGNLRIQINSDDPVVLNNSNVSVRNLAFVRDSTIDGVESISVSFVLTTTTSHGQTLSKIVTATQYISTV